MKFITIIQARMGSSRLPEKVLMPLAGKPVIRWVYERAKLIKNVSETWVATTTDKADDKLYDYCSKNDIPVFRGNPDDVLDRYYQLAKKLNPDAVIRITGDCPLLDPLQSNRHIDAFINNQPCDYIVPDDKLPDGLATEVIKFSALEKSWKEAKSIPYREHVTLYIPSHKESFKIIALSYHENLLHHRWTIDEPRDYDFLSKIADKITQKKVFGHMNEIIDILKENPELMSINYDIGFNEGLAKSLQTNPLID